MDAFGSAKTRETLAQYIVRPPVSLQNLLVDEGGTDTVICRAPCSDFFKTDTKLFPAVGFLAEVPQHFSDPRCRLIDRSGLTAPQEVAEAIRFLLLNEGNPVIDELNIRRPGKSPWV